MCSAFYKISVVDPPQLQVALWLIKQGVGQLFKSVRCSDHLGNKFLSAHVYGCTFKGLTGAAVVRLPLRVFSRQKPSLRSERDSLINHPIINNANTRHSANVIFFFFFSPLLHRV